MRVSPQARKKCPALPEFWEARAIRTIDARGRERERVLLTTLDLHNQSHHVPCDSQLERKAVEFTCKNHSLVNFIIRLPVSSKRQVIVLSLMLVIHQPLPGHAI